MEAVGRRAFQTGARTSSLLGWGMCSLAEGEEVGQGQPEKPLLGGIWILSKV